MNCGTIFVSVDGLWLSSNIHINLKTAAAKHASEIINMRKVSRNMNHTFSIHLP